MDFTNVIAEPPYDDMGREFAIIFGTWCNETVLTKDSNIIGLAYDLFTARLALAEKYKTFFATQVTEKGESGKPLWQERLLGIGNVPAYSFATPVIPRTVRFHKWCEMVKETPNGTRRWDTHYAPFPNLPGNPTPYPVMQVWAHRYEPRFTARQGGPFECRRMKYGNDFYLIEHPRSRWIGMIFHECKTYWNIALDPKNDREARIIALASFEWLWYWANPFMRSGAMTADALSLVMQKHIGAVSRQSFYHQDCEALLMTFDDYVAKRHNDMVNGFVYKFPM
jgi:hypothetical protein